MNYNTNEMMYIGIDTGTQTGFAVWNKQERRLEQVKTMMIHAAMFTVLDMHQRGVRLHVRIEDARKATRGRHTVDDAHKLQGAGSVKRDAAIWEGFLKDYGIPHEMVRPSKAITKLGKYAFERLTLYKNTTSSHGRDAAMLVYGL